MSMHEIDSARPMPASLIWRVVLTCFLLGGVTAFGLLDILRPDSRAQLQHWVSNEVATMLGKVHQTTEKAKDTDWTEKMQQVKEVAEEALAPVEVLEPLPTESIEE